MHKAEPALLDPVSAVLCGIVFQFGAAGGSSNSLTVDPVSYFPRRRLFGGICGALDAL